MWEWGDSPLFQLDGSCQGDQRGLEKMGVPNQRLLGYSRFARNPEP